MTSIKTQGPATGLALTLILFSIIACSVSRQPQENATIVISFIDTAKFDSGKRSIYGDSTLVTYAGDLTFYQVPVTVPRARVRVKEGTSEIVSIEQHSDSITYYYIFKREGDSVGYLYDSIDSPHPKHIPLDSFEKNDLFLTFPFYTKEHYFKVREEKRSGDTLLKVYSVKLKGEGPDSIYYYFAKGFDKVPYSFSKTLEGETGLKLVKVKALLPPEPVFGSSVTEYATSTSYFEIKKRPPVRNAAIDALWKRFEDYIK